MGRNVTQTRNYANDDFGVFQDGEDKIACTYKSAEAAELAVLKRILKE